jgi:hypothetical protein
MHRTKSIPFHGQVWSIEVTHRGHTYIKQVRHQPGQSCLEQVGNGMDGDASYKNLPEFCWEVGHSVRHKNISNHKHKLCRNAKQTGNNQSNGKERGRGGRRREKTGRSVSLPHRRGMKIPTTDKDANIPFFLKIKLKERQKGEKEPKLNPNL